MKLIICLFSLGLILTSCKSKSGAFADDCSEILKAGIYDYTKDQSQHFKSLSYINWFLNSEVNTYQEAKSRSFEATVPIDDILIGMNFSKNEQGFSELKKYVETYVSLNEVEKNKLDITLQKINEKVVEAWMHCQDRKGSINMWVSHTEKPDEFVLCANYVDDGTGSKPKIISFQGLNNLQTDNGDFIDEAGHIKNTVINGGTRCQIFKRKNLEAFTINIKCSFGDAFLYKFATISKLECTEFENDNTLSGSGINKIVKDYGPFEKDLCLHFTVKNTCMSTEHPSRLGILVQDHNTQQTIWSDQTQDIKDNMDFGGDFVIKFLKGQKKSLEFITTVKHCSPINIKVDVEKSR